MKNGRKSTYGFNDIKVGAYKIFDKEIFHPSKIRQALACHKYTNRERTGQWYFILEGIRPSDRFGYTIVYLCRSKEELISLKQMSRVAASKYIWTSFKPPVMTDISQERLDAITQGENNA